MYTVLNDFIEKEHDHIRYSKGETYPKKGYKTEGKRVEFLQKEHPKYGVVFLDTPKEEPKPKAMKSSVKSND
ncbi:hypothetical protein [Bacillus cihuensis]|uniref:hypothetical protein n=1 Tax=Bacillus cihuensis TaxID=1208599 RepID=UPI0003FE7506|nr:hypothetical protein [Bacillus cihuensis]